MAREILANKNELTKASWHEFVLGIMSSHILLLHFFVRMLNFSLDSQVIVVCVTDGVGVCTTYAYAHLPKISSPTQPTMRENGKINGCGTKTRESSRPTLMKNVKENERQFLKKNTY